MFTTERDIPNFALRQFGRYIINVRERRRKEHFFFFAQLREGVIQGKILSRLEDTDSVKYWQLAYYGLLVEMGGFPHLV